MGQPGSPHDGGQSGERLHGRSQQLGHELENICTVSFSPATTAPEAVSNAGQQEQPRQTQPKPLEQRAHRKNESAIVHRHHRRPRPGLVPR
jgi:hypothetical protein